LRVQVHFPEESPVTGVAAQRVVIGEGRKMENRAVLILRRFFQPVEGPVCFVKSQIDPGKAGRRHISLPGELIQLL
jgi:hypothetical protein